MFVSAVVRGHTTVASLSVFLYLLRPKQRYPLKTDIMEQLYQALNRIMHQIRFYSLDFFCRYINRQSTGHLHLCYCNVMGQLFSIILRTKHCVAKLETMCSETSGAISIDKMKLAWRAGLNEMFE